MLLVFHVGLFALLMHDVNAGSEIFSFLTSSITDAMRN